jgi:hypothetical protein
MLLVGRLGPCEICQLEAERLERRQARATPRPCAAGRGRTVAGAATYCSSTCRNRAYRARRRAAVIA